MARDPDGRRSVWLDRDTWIDRRGRKWVRNPLYRKERMTVTGGILWLWLAGAGLRKLGAALRNRRA
jgi:hypothetical protein